MDGRYDPYIRAAGDDLESEDRFDNWEDLRGWLDAQPLRRIDKRVRRVSAAASPIELSFREWLRRKFGFAPPAVAGQIEPRGWESVVAHRQRLSLGLTTASTLGLLYVTYRVLDDQQMPMATLVIYMVIYAAMTFFLTSNFWKTMLGTLYVLQGPAGNPWHPSRTARDPDIGTKVAIVYPVYHEDVARVAAGMATTWESLANRHPEFARHFHMFLISDSRLPEYALAEEAAVHELSRSFPEARFYFRRRAINANAKLGNVEDFCRRWGSDYRYMLVMDADSVMDGDAVVALLRMMEGNDRIGILQTNPKPALRQSLFGRMQQFSARLFGSVFAYSLQVMYMGNASYIGHNALIRLQPFIEHCFLPNLSGPKPWGGKPMSHDIVESAMMARAGYEVWFLPEIEGSYEEVPANIVGFLIRERRWMQGNLQHLRFLFMPGLRSIHRETFLNGSLGYIAAPLWAIFLVLSTAWMLNFMANGLSALQDLAGLQVPMFFLMSSGLIFLFLPRLIALAVFIDRRYAWQYGGKAKLVISVLLETAFSIIFSPIIMISVTRFLWFWVKRKSISWGNQDRGDAPLPWRQCLQHFSWVSAIGLTALYLMQRGIGNIPPNLGLIMETMSDGWAKAEYLLYAYAPILLGFIGSIWIVRVTSLTFPAVRRARIFCIPEEIDTPAVLAAVITWQRKFEDAVPDPAQRSKVLQFVVSDPQFFVAHRPQTRIRRLVAARLLPKIRAGDLLTDEELLLALGERRCFELMHFEARH